MFVLDTDILTLLLMGHERVTARRAQVTEEVALTAVTRTGQPSHIGDSQPEGLPASDGSAGRELGGLTVVE